MTYRVDPLIHAMQATDPSPSQYRMLADASGHQLASRDHAVLSFRDLGDHLIGPGVFPAHMTGKSPGNSDSPPYATELPAMSGR